MEKDEKKKKVKKIRKNVTVRLAIFTVVLIFLTPALINSLSYLLPSLMNVFLFYFVGIISGFIGLIARSISMCDHIDYKIINKKYTFDVDEQRKIIRSAYYFKYLIFMIPTILAFISFAILTLEKFFKKPLITLIFIFSISMLIGFIQKSPKDLS